MTLTDRIEAASEPTPELFWEAWDCFSSKDDWVNYVNWPESNPHKVAHDYRCRFATLVDAKAYTEAALMLVPEGYEWKVGWWNQGRPLPSIMGASLVCYENSSTPHRVAAEAATPALALLAAAMKARGR